MLTLDELVLILNKYSFDEPSSLEHLTDGWTNLTYKFQLKSNEKSYILREYLPTTQRIIIFDEIQFELNFISYLFQQYHLPVVPMIDPPGIFILSNGHYGVIFPFIEGIKYVNTPTNARRQLWQTIEISRFLGRMHSIGKQEIFNRRIINIVDVKYQLVNSCEQFANDCPDLYQRIRRILDQHTKSIPLIENELEQIKFEENLPKGLIHMDIHDDNVLFHPHENQIVAVLDFDDMSYGPFLLDLAMALCFWCSIGSQFQIDYAKQFLTEYQTARKMLLTNDEWNLLELYCYMTMFHQMLFTIQSRDNREVNDEMIEELLLPIEQISRDQLLSMHIQEKKMNELK
jgi:Ser/Thr protein kinase RdoA (MazF antagonist)